MSAPGDFGAALRRFAFSQQPFGPDVTEVRLQRLRAVVRHANRHVPMYRELYRAHDVQIDAIKTPDDLWRLPAVSKVNYTRAGPKGYTDERGDLLNPYTQTTSGSVGTALHIYSAPDEASQMLAALWAGWVGWGVTPDDRLLMMSAPYLAEEVEPFNSLFVPVQIPPEDLVASFRAFRPTVIIGMVESIALLAVQLRQRNIDERHQVRAIFPFGQTYSEQLRRMVTSGFDAEICELYGSAEAGWLGYECKEHNGMHVPEGRIVVHIARTGRADEPAAPGETGEVIVTSLLRGTTPFIRYRLNDAAALDPTPCPCGRSSPRIVNVEGRIQDFLVATDGHWVGPGTLTLQLVVGRPEIVDHRIVQEDREHVHVSLVVSPNFEDSERKTIAEMLRRNLGPVRVDVDLVAEIPRDPSGKRRRVFRKFDLPDV